METCWRWTSCVKTGSTMVTSEGSTACKNSPDNLSIFRQQQSVCLWTLVYFCPLPPRTLRRPGRSLQARRALSLGRIRGECQFSWNLCKTQHTDFATRPDHLASGARVAAQRGLFQNKHLTRLRKLRRPKRN